MLKKLKQNCAVTVSSMTSLEATSISTQVTPTDLMIMNDFDTQCNIKPLNYDDNDENPKQSVKVVIRMKVSTTKVKTNMTMIVLQILLLLTLERCLQKLLLLFIGCP